VPSNHDIEHEQATLEAERAPRGQESTESLLESSSNLRQDTQNPPDSTRSNDPQADQDTLGAHPDDEGEGEEHSDQTDRCEASLKKAANSALEPAAFVEDEQYVS
jgi:hypothetical protein